MQPNDYRYPSNQLGGEDFLMVKLDFDMQFSSARYRADRDPDAAAEALLIFAARLREGRELTPDLVDYVAGAIEASMGKPQKKRGPALLRELNLTAGNRRPTNVDHIAAGRDFDALVESGRSQNSAAAQIAADFGISETTATKFWKEHLRVEEENEKMRDDDEYGG
jgi:hypothetical protein